MTLQNGFELLSTIRAETEAGLDKDHRDIHGDMDMKTREYDASRAKIGKLLKILAILQHEPKVNERNM